MGNKQTIFTEEQLDNYQVSPAAPDPEAAPFVSLPPSSRRLPRPPESRLTRFKPCFCLQLDA